MGQRFVGFRSAEYRVAAATVAIGALAAGLLSSCSSTDQVPSIGYAVDSPLTTYNANTTQGAASAAPVAFPRVLTGMSYTGPEGNAIADTDYGTANVVPGDALTIQYRLNPAGVYSDGVPTSCEDLVLAWAARSGRFTKNDDAGKSVPMFDAANTAGYADIERVQCQAGSKDATVVFRPGRGFAEWRSLFGATDLMPAHVAAKVANVSDIVSVIAANDKDAVGRIADFWNNGWKLTPGQIDPSLLPSSGPYRIESYSNDDGLILVANDKWWGNKPATPRIVLWPKNTNIKDKVASGAVEVADLGANSIDGLDFSGFTHANAPSRNSEQLTLGTTGVFASPDARKALALCTPRQALFDKLGHPDYIKTSGLGSGPLNSRLVQADTLIYPAESGEGAKYPGGDVPGAVAALAAAGIQTPTVKIGYLAPDDRRAQTVKAIADACKPAGINVEDAGSPQFDPAALRAGQVEAVLGGTAAAPGSAGATDNTDARFALRAGSGTNYGNYNNPRYDAIVDQLSVDASPATQLSASGEAETLLWAEMPTIPLFNEPRTTAFADGMEAGIPNPSKSGAGWNMDKWVLKR
ncbi:ABC transporter substrate-binding protein [Antrihabitans cavernicola]|uniref:Peptide-binding protein n=1 Tax=Antrihabitans cavernicola TaxID=2495913 RepID=A0A5A7SG61_9NOCA|nr:ABC transporter substrate-binding protein [Spelaeibacter cavernicola]KAA0023475.1 peptide-binding protein [Spelaeibacter cavernicola]